VIELGCKASGEILLLWVSGKVDSTTAPQLEQGLLAELPRAERRWVLDLAAVDYLSSAGLRVLLTLGRRLEASGRQLALCGAQQTVAEVLAIAGFDQLLPVLPSRAEALGTFRPRPAPAARGLAAALSEVLGLAPLKPAPPARQEHAESVAALAVKALTRKTKR
jgi:stage II sporulation protein AA (anti-sigma F factor antagonist)